MSTSNRFHSSSLITAFKSARPLPYFLGFIPPSSLATPSLAEKKYFLPNASPSVSHNAHSVLKNGNACALNSLSDRICSGTATHSGQNHSVSASARLVGSPAHTAWNAEGHPSQHTKEPDLPHTEHISPCVSAAAAKACSRDFTALAFFSTTSSVPAMYHSSPSHVSMVSTSSFLISFDSFSPGN